MNLNDDVKAFLDGRSIAVLATLNADGSPQRLTPERIIGFAS